MSAHYARHCRFEVRYAEEAVRRFSDEYTHALVRAQRWDRVTGCDEWPEPDDCTQAKRSHSIRLWQAVYDAHRLLVSWYRRRDSYRARELLARLEAREEIPGHSAARVAARALSLLRGAT